MAMLMQLQREFETLKNSNEEELSILGASESPKLASKSKPKSMNSVSESPNPR